MCYLPLLDDLRRHFDLLIHDCACALIVLAFVLLLFAGLCVGCLLLCLAEALER